MYLVLEVKQLLPVDSVRSSVQFTYADGLHWAALFFLKKKCALAHARWGNFTALLQLLAY